MIFAALRSSLVLTARTKASTLSNPMRFRTAAGFLTSNVTSTVVAVVAPGSATPIFTIQGNELTNPSYVATTL